MSHPRDTKTLEPLAEKEIANVEFLLSRKRPELCPNIDDRDFWDYIGSFKASAVLIDTANELLEAPLKETSDDLYREFYETGNRRNYELILVARRKYLTTLVKAECLENKGRFLKFIKSSIEGFCQEKSWLLPAHDPNQSNIKEEDVDVDLGAAMFAFDLSSAYQILRPRLEKGTLKLIEDNINHRILAPFKAMLAGERPHNWWLTHHSNWNSVCLAGILGSALIIERDKKQIALIVAAVAKYIPNFIGGFSDTGYCFEGVGYWNYGFVHFLLAGHLLNAATDGKIDIFDSAKVDKMANFANECEIINSVYPSFADCGLDVKPYALIGKYFERRFCRLAEQSSIKDLRPSIADFLTARLSRKDEFNDCLNEMFNKHRNGAFIYEFFTLGTTIFDQNPAEMPTEISCKGMVRNSDFEEAGVIVCRHYSQQDIFGLALKAGDNQELHNHNDVGSYVLVLNDQPILIDVGNEIYTAKTFSPQRYESQALNSFGHPVPVVADCLQPVGKEYRGQITKKEFSADQDVIELDLTKAYDVSVLSDLQRTFIFDRHGLGSLTLIDRVEFSQASNFETALITLGQIEVLSANQVMISQDGQSIVATISCQAADFSINIIEIIENFPDDRKRMRLGIKLEKPVLAATIKVVIEPGGLL